MPLPGWHLRGEGFVRLPMKRHLTLACCSLTLLLGVSTKNVSAEIFQYTDEDGVIHFSNVGVAPGKKYRKVASEPRHAEQTAPSPSQTHPETPPSATQQYVPGTYGDIITSACSRHGVDPALVHAIVKVESDFNPYALSRKGAIGLMQLMPQTAVDWNVQNSFSPNENIDGGVRYLRYLLDRYEGNISLALAAYNSGETAVQKWGTIPPYPETQNYVQRILKLYNGTGSSAAPHYTIFVGYGEDGAIVLTDDPSKHSGKKETRRTSSPL